MSVNTNHNVTDKIISRIRRLLALAQSSNPNEAAVAQAKAEKLAADNGISLSAQDFSNPNETPDVIEKDNHKLPSNSMWRSVLGWAIAKYCHVQVLRDGRDGGRTLHVIGTPQDISLWRTLFTRAEDEIDSMGKKYAWGRSRKEADAFRKGAAEGFKEKLLKYAQEAANSPNGKVSAALEAPNYDPNSRGWMILVSRDNAVRQKTHKYFPYIRSVSVSNVGGNAYGEGKVFGRNMNTHTGNIKG